MERIEEQLHREGNPSPFHEVFNLFSNRWTMDLLFAEDLEINLQVKGKLDKPINRYRRHLPNHP
jgi:hypothetical protein